MSQASVSVTPPPEPGTLRELCSVVGWIGAMLVFLALTFVAYIPYRPDPVDQHLVQVRTERLRELRAQEQRMARAFEILEREQGIVRIPIDVARDLAAERLSRTDPEPEPEAESEPEPEPDPEPDDAEENEP